MQDDLVRCERLRGQQVDGAEGEGAAPHGQRQRARGVQGELCLVRDCRVGVRGAAQLYVPREREDLQGLHCDRASRDLV